MAPVRPQEIRITVGMAMTPEVDRVLLHEPGKVRCVVGGQGGAFHLGMDTLG